MTKKLVFFNITLFLCTMLSAQIDYSAAYSYPAFNPADSQKVILRIENHNFFKNNEYFGQYVEGETLLGYDLEPSVMYYPGSRIRLKVGAHMRKFSGVESFSSVTPVVSAHALLTDSLQMILGNLSGNVQHQMSEPIYDSEFLYTNPTETGIQFLYNSRVFKGDMWLSWEQFVFKGDTIPEILTFGLSSTFKLITQNNWQLSVPLQLIVHHEGGQISNFDQPMLTLNNGLTGLTFEKKISSRYIKKIRFDAQYLWFADLTEKRGLPFTSGSAFYPTMLISGSHSQFMGGYFYGHNFASPKGSPLFQSVSTYLPSVYSPNRQIVTFKYNYAYCLAKGVNLTALADAYYDGVAGNFEYAYGVSLHVNPEFFIAKLPIVK